jgi:hypothetical protein
VAASAATFNQEKAKERKRRGFISPRAARTPRPASAAAAVPPAPASNQIRILASLPLADYATLPPAAVKALAGDILKRIYPGGQVVILQDPPELEIRIPG